VLFLAGADEVFVDDVEIYVENVKVCSNRPIDPLNWLIHTIQVHNKNRIDLLLAAGECHDAPFLDLALGFNDANCLENYASGFLINYDTIGISQAEQKQIFVDMVFFTRVYPYSPISLV
jgi:hypothetical protein